MSWWNVRSSWASQSQVQASGRVAATGRPVAVRVGRVVDGPGERFERPAVDVLGRGERHRLGGPAVIAVAEREDGRSSGGDPRQLDRRLDRFGARVRQERLPRSAGQEPAKPVVEPQPGLVVQDVLLAVEQLRRLRGDGRGDPRMGVPGVRDADPGRVVEVALAVAGDQPRPFAAVDVQVRDPAPDSRDDGMVGQGTDAGGSDAAGGLGLAVSTMSGLHFGEGGTSGLTLETFRPGRGWRKRPPGTGLEDRGQGDEPDRDQEECGADHVDLDRHADAGGAPDEDREGRRSAGGEAVIT